MNCPRCAAEVPDNGVDCPWCGVVFAKVRAKPGANDDVVGGGVEVATPPAVPLPSIKLLRDPPAPPPPEFLGITHAGWKAAAIGAGMALGLTFFPFLSFILSPLSTMVHEIGHTVVLWLFGYPAIPAFDFANGGGVTLSDLERAPSIVWAWGLGVVMLGWWQRERKGVLTALGGAAVVYFLMFNTTKEVLAITLGGHAGEVVFGALFLYRALTGWGCKIEAERPLYAFLAFVMLFASLRLGWSLTHETIEKAWYLQGKGGIDHDLVTGAQILSWRLEGIARMLIAVTLAAIPLSFYAASRRRILGAVSEAEEEA